MVTRTRLSVMLYVHTVCLLVIEKGCDHREVLVEAEVTVEQRALETNYTVRWQHSDKSTRVSVDG
jgi:hypothetical protein